MWARGAAPVALRYWVRDGYVVCDDASAGERTVGDGDRRQAGAVSVTVRTGAGTPAVVEAPRPLPPAPPPVAPPPPVVVAKPAPPAPTPILKPAPPAPKPPAPEVPASSAAPGERCPTPGCGRAAAGLPGKRYCMVCDHYF